MNVNLDIRSLDNEVFLVAHHSEVARFEVTCKKVCALFLREFRDVVEFLIESHDVMFAKDHCSCWKRNEKNLVQNLFPQTKVTPWPMVPKRIQLGS